MMRCFLLVVVGTTLVRRAVFGRHFMGAMRAHSVIVKRAMRLALVSGGDGVEREEKKEFLCEMSEKLKTMVALVRRALVDG